MGRYCMAYFYRKSPRIPGFDYSSVNYYFITICTRNRRCIFGKPNNLNLLGKIAQEEIEELSTHYAAIHVDKYVVMPNHVHLILIISSEQNAGVNQIIAQYKSGVTRKIRQIRPSENIWQRSFHDHVIRNQESYEKIWNYIDGNPKKWEEDCFYVNENLFINHNVR